MIGKVILRLQRLMGDDHKNATTPHDTFIDGGGFLENGVFAIHVQSKFPET